MHVWAFCCAILLGSMASAATPDTVRLRAVTFNIWGVEVLNRNLELRLAKIGPALVQLDADLIALQEVWGDDQVEVLRSALADAGYVHVLSYNWPAKSGLMIVSRLPIAHSAFTAFDIGDTPHSPWHLDWLVDKGVAQVEVDTALGPVVFATTHLQAQYTTDSYEMMRLAQSVRVCAELLQASAPLILVGDINSAATELPYRLLRDTLSLQIPQGVPGPNRTPFQASPHDIMMVRRGGQLRIRSAVMSRRLFEQVVLSADISGSLSDHAAFVLDIEFERTGPPPAKLNASIARGETVAEAIKGLTIGREATRWRTTAALLVSLALPLLLVAATRRRRRRLPVMVWVVAATLSIWLLYVGVVYGWVQVAALERAEATLRQVGRMGG